MRVSDKSYLPSYNVRVDKDGMNVSEYMQELTHALEDQYDEMSSAINGTIFSDLDEDENKYVPVILGSTADGVGTYVADHQTAYAFRMGSFVDVWFDISWTAHTGTGNLLLELPYKSIQFDNEPFVASVSADNLVFSGYLVGSVIPDSFNMEILDVQSGGAAVNIAVSNFATTLRGHVRYPINGEE